MAYDLDEFLDSYWFDAAEYRALREKCERFNVWERVHEFILRHLSTGCDLAAEEGWPLPKTGTSITNDRIEGYPKLTLLIQIALEDGRPKDALAWYGQSVSGCGGIREYELDKLGWEVADAVVDCNPAEKKVIFIEDKAEIAKPAEFRRARRQDVLLQAGGYKVFRFLADRKNFLEYSLGPALKIGLVEHGMVVI